MELFSYHRSSASYRVRIVLNMKEVDCRIIPVDLLKSEEKADAYLEMNPQGLVPTMRLEDGSTLAQSMAIIEYLEERFPVPPLLADDPVQRAQQRGMAALIASDIHPLNNLRVLNYLQKRLAVSEQEKRAWYAHWITQGFLALEPQLQAAPFACGGRVSLVDVLLVPQVFNALRFEVTLENFPRIQSVYTACNQLDAFVRAAPEKQLTHSNSS